MPKQRTKKTKEKLKNKILTDLYESGIMQNKIKGYCLKNRIPIESDIHQDIVQRTFLELSKKDADFIIELDADKVKKNRLIGLAVTIACRKGFSKHPSGYPGHSTGQQLLFASTLNHNNYHLNPLEDCDEDDSDNNKHKALSTDEGTQPIDILFEDIRTELNEEENKVLETWLTQQTKKSYKKKKELSEKHQQLFEKIRQIIIDKKIKNLTND